MDLIYYDPYPNQPLEEYLAEYNALQANYGAPSVSVKRVETVEEVLREADVRTCLCPCMRQLHSLPPSAYVAGSLVPLMP